MEEQKYVYGFFEEYTNDNSDGYRLLSWLGIFETEELAWKKFHELELSNNVYVHPVEFFTE